MDNIVTQGNRVCLRACPACPRKIGLPGNARSAFRGPRAWGRRRWAGGSSVCGAQGGASPARYRLCSPVVFQLLMKLQPEAGESLDLPMIRTFDS